MRKLLFLSPFLFISLFFYCEDTEIKLPQRPKLGGEFEFQHEKFSIKNEQDLEKAKEFYQDILALKDEKEQGMVDGVVKVSHLSDIVANIIKYVTTERIAVVHTPPTLLTKMKAGVKDFIRWFDRRFKSDKGFSKTQRDLEQLNTELAGEPNDPNLKYLKAKSLDRFEVLRIDLISERQGEQDKLKILEENEVAKVRKLAENNGLKQLDLESGEGPIDGLLGIGSRGISSALVLKDGYSWQATENIQNAVNAEVIKITFGKFLEQMPNGDEIARLQKAFDALKKKKGGFESLGSESGSFRVSTKGSSGYSIEMQTASSGSNEVRDFRSAYAGLSEVIKAKLDVMLCNTIKMFDENYYMPNVEKIMASKSLVQIDKKVDTFAQQENNVSKLNSMIAEIDQVPEIKAKVKEEKNIRDSIVKLYKKTKTLGDLVLSKFDSLFSGFTSSERLDLKNELGAQFASNLTIADAENEIEKKIKRPKKINPRLVKLLSRLGNRIERLFGKRFGSKINSGVQKKAWG